MSFLLSAALLISLGSSLFEEEHYSANTLIASFAKDPRSTLKGASITVSDVVAEMQMSKVIFRSSGNDKVICELRSPVPKGTLPGTLLTVTGRVRGRGALGNVTLDDCSAVVLEKELSALSLDTIPTPAPVALPVESPAVMLDEPVDQPAEISPVQSPRTAAAPITTNHPTSRLPGPVADNAQNARGNTTPSANPITANAAPVTALVPAASALEMRSVAFIAGGFVAGILFVALVRGMPSILHSRRQRHSPTTAEMRRAALESLLSREKKA